MFSDSKCLFKIYKIRFVVVNRFLGNTWSTHVLSELANEFKMCALLLRHFSMCVLAMLKFCF